MLHCNQCHCKVRRNMPLRVVIDDEVGRVLKGQAEPLVDSVNSVLRRILELPGAPQSPVFFEIEQIGSAPPKRITRDGSDARIPAPARPPRKARAKRRAGKQERPRSRAPKGSLLDEKAYWKPILETLAGSPDGAAPAREVVDRVGDAIGDRLTVLDREEVSSGGLRWHTRVMFARLRMKDAGLLKKDSPRGVWEISDLGRQALAEGRVDIAA